MDLVHTSMHQIVSATSKMGRSMVRRRGKQNGAEKERIMMRKSTKTGFGKRGLDCGQTTSLKLTLPQTMQIAICSCIKNWLMYREGNLRLITWFELLTEHMSRGN